VNVLLPVGAPIPPQNHTVTHARGQWRVEWRGGDVVRPFGGQGFGPVFPVNVLRLRCPRRILPFVTWGPGVVPFSNGGYLGFKAFGVDRAEYRAWLPGPEIFEGSVALCPSFRFSITS